MKGDETDSYSRLFDKVVSLDSLLADAKSSKHKPLEFAKAMVSEWQRYKTAASSGISPASFFKQRFGEDPSKYTGSQQQSVRGTIYKLLEKMEPVAQDTSLMCNEYIVRKVIDNLQNGWSAGESMGEVVLEQSLEALDLFSQMVNWEAPLIAGTAPKQIASTRQ